MFLLNIKKYSIVSFFKCLSSFATSINNNRLLSIIRLDDAIKSKDDLIQFLSYFLSNLAVFLLMSFL